MAACSSRRATEARLGRQSLPGRGNLDIQIGGPRRGAGLALERRLTARQLGSEVTRALEPVGDAGQLGFGAPAATTRQRHTGRLFDHGAQLARPCGAHGLDLALPDDGQGIRAQADGAERLMDVQQPAGRRR